MIVFVALVCVEVVVDANSLWMFFCEVVKENISLGWLQPYSFLAWNIENAKVRNWWRETFQNNQQCLEEVYIESKSIFNQQVFWVCCHILWSRLRCVVGKDSKVRLHFACIADKLYRNLALELDPARGTGTHLSSAFSKLNWLLNNKFQIKINVSYLNKALVVGIFAQVIKTPP